MVQAFLRANERFLAKSLTLSSRLLLIIGAACLVGSFFFPLWKMTLVAPQYRDGLNLYIYSYQLEGGGVEGQDLREINILNHYIGMRALEEADFVEMQWIPFALGLFILLSLRGVVFGRMGNVVDLLALVTYFGLFSMANFYYRLYTYGTQLDPTAPMTIEPFVPVLIGRNQIANFTQYSYPQGGSYFLLGFAICLVLAMFLSRKEQPSVSGAL